MMTADTMGAAPDTATGPTIETGALDEATRLLARNGSPDAFRAAAAHLPGLIHIPARFNALFWTLHRALASSAVAAPLETRSRLWQDHLAPAWLPFAQTQILGLPASIDRPHRAPDNTPRIAIATHQVLTPHHARTGRILDLAEGLARQHGAEVLIVNANSYPLVWEHGIERQMIGNVHPQLSGAQTIDVHGTSIALFSERNRAFGPAKILGCRTALLEFNPDVVIGFGGFNIAADSVSPFVPVLAHPLAGEDPIAAAHVILGSGDPAIQPHAARLGDWQVPPCTAQVPFAYRIPEARGTLTRADLDLDEHAFVIALAGTRLAREVDADVETTLVSLLTANPAIHLVLAGPEELTWHDPSMAAFADRVHLLGHANDLRALYRCCDLVLNHARLGGAGSLLPALAEGVPVLAHTGEGAALLGPDDAQTSLEASRDLAIALSFDKALHRQWRERAGLAAERLSDFSSYLDRIVSLANEVQAAAPALWPQRDTGLLAHGAV